MISALAVAMTPTLVLVPTSIFSTVGRMVLAMMYLSCTTSTVTGSLTGSALFATM
jgi:hypothetical protein